MANLWHRNVVSYVDLWQMIIGFVLEFLENFGCGVLGREIWQRRGNAKDEWGTNNS